MITTFHKGWVIHLGIPTAVLGMPECLQYWNPAGRVYRGPQKVITLLYGQPHVLIFSTASGQQW